MKPKRKVTTKKKPTQPGRELSAESVLRDAELRRTPVRVGVIELLSNEAHPLSAQQIIDRLPKFTDAVTVYRTLTTLTKSGVLHRIHGDDRVWRFAMGVNEKQAFHEHAHFVCDDCGTVECFNEVPVPRNSSRELKGAEGYDISYSEILIHGTCPRCLGSGG